MPERFIVFWNNFELIIMTMISMLLGVLAFLVTYAVAIIAIVPSIVSTIYWLNRIRNEQVRKYYNGSWLKWARASFRFKQNRKKIK